MEIRIDKLDFYELRLIDETGNHVSFNLQKELSVNEDNLAKEMLEQPSKYIYWSSLLEKIRLYLESSELELELLEGSLDKEARDRMMVEGIKPTKDAVDGYIKRTERYKKAREKVNYYEYITKRLYFIVKSFEQRKDLLQSYGRVVTDDKRYGSGAGTRLEDTDQHKHPFGSFRQE